jgi:hypothetical protein
MIDPECSISSTRRRLAGSARRGSVGERVNSSMRMSASFWA